MFYIFLYRSSHPVGAYYHSSNPSFHSTVSSLIFSFVLCLFSSAQPPASPLAGFYRALLRLSQHNWDVTPLIVDLSAEGKELQNPAIQAEIVNKFNALRNNSTEVCL